MTFPRVVEHKHLHREIYGEREKNIHRPPQVYNRSSALSQVSPSTEPFIFNLPGKASAALVLHEINRVVTVVNQDNFIGKALVYDFETGNLAYSFEIRNNIMSIFHHRNILFVQPYNAWQIQAWDLNTGKPFDLPETWNRVNKMCFSDQYVVHNNFTDPVEAKEAQKPIVLQISDPITLKPLQKIQTGLFDIKDMAIADGQLFVLGIDENNTVETDNDSRSACVMRYDTPLNENSEKLKASFNYDYNGGYDHALKIHQGTLFNTAWCPSVVSLWDSNTLDSLLEKSDTGGAFTAVMEDTAVIIDDKEMAICRKEQNKFSVVKTIEWNKNDTGSCIEIFHFSKRKFTAEGYESGIVRIRDLETFGVSMELNPPQNMREVLHTQFVNDKLLVHYNKPSTDGTLAVLWNLKTQTPELLITRKALVGRDYQSKNDYIHIVDKDILVVSEDQVMLYKGVI